MSTTRQTDEERILTAVRHRFEQTFPETERPKVEGDLSIEDGWWIIPVVYARESEDLFGYIGKLSRISIDLRKELGFDIELAPVPMRTAA